jgi:hypothetical protein
MSKHHAKQIQITWDAPEAFALVPQQGIDWDRRAREQAQAEAERKESDKCQMELCQLNPAA